MSKQKKKRHGVAWLVILLILAIGALGFVGYKYFRVKNIVVEGTVNKTEEYVIELSDIKLQMNMLKVQEKKVRENIEADPYLELVEFKRKFPDTIYLTVKEREKKAKVEYAGSVIYIDGEGNILEIAQQTGEEQDQLPVMTGIDVSSFNLGQKIAFSDTLRYNAMLEIIAQIYDKGLNTSIAEVDFTNINSIRMKEVGGIDIKFGQADEVEQKMKWLKAVLAQLKERNYTSGTLDVSTGESASFRPDQTLDNEPTDQTE